MPHGPASRVARRGGGTTLGHTGRANSGAPAQPRVFTLSEMLGGAAFSSAPIISGQLYAIRPEAPLLSSIAASLVLIPTLLLTQRRIRPEHTTTDAATTEPSPPASFADPEAA